VSLHRRPRRSRRPQRASAAAALLVIVGVVAALVLTRSTQPARSSATTTTPSTSTTATSTSRPRSSTTTSVVPTTTTPGINAPGVGLARPITLRASRRGVLTGDVIAIDPGHNGENYAHPTYINHLVWNGRENEACDTTGTATATGYSEAQFNWNVAVDLQADLRNLGATVVLTRSSNTTYGPCITQRAAIGNRAHAVVAISIHADGGPPGGRGFAILVPVADGINNRIVAPSLRFARALRTSFLRTGMPESTYDGVDGIQPRDDLGGTNLSTVPKVFLECGNMRNTTDATLLEEPRWQRAAAMAIAEGMVAFLGRGG
jgi:N-acetylmuramoyl-L-alanine amidase